MADDRAAVEWYSLAVTVERTGVSAQRLRVLEREGLIRPARRGREARFSADDLARIRKIRRLVEDLGINLAGVEVILRLTAELEELRRERWLPEGRGR